VVFQFSLSIILITGIVIIHSQLNYVKNMDLGFDQRQRIVLNVYTNGSDIAGMMGALRLLPGVTAASRSNSELGKKLIQDRNLYLAGGASNKGLDVQNMVSDEYFVRAAGIRLINGHDFGAHDSGKVIINETLARRLHLDPRTAPGTHLYSKWGDYPEEKFVVSGVVKDFNFSSLHEDIQPFMLICDPNSPSLCTIMVSCNTGDYKGMLDRISGVWHRYVPGGAPLEYAFMDDEINKLYETDITLSDIINSFTGVAILISCLGLFGLAAFSAEQRKKEIGVRKVLGASVSGITRLLSTEFLRLVGIALLVSIPVSWWVMREWLRGFAYRTPIQWWMFALSGAAAIVIAGITVGFHTIRAARGNPVSALRSE